MVAQYTVFGRQVGSHILAIATLSTLFVGATVSLSGGKKAKQTGPPIKAESTDEESFIKEFLKNAEAEEKKQGAKA